MKAWLIRRYGGPERLELAEVAAPQPGRGDVLVEVRAASVNPLDWKIRAGKLRRVEAHQLPLILGNDLSGVVVAVGAGVTRFQVGDEVFGRVAKHRIGCFAEQIAVDERDLARKPKHLTHAEAGSIPLVALTAWQAFVDVAPLRRGQRVFIPAGAGGVGTIAIQIARHLGADVATTASAGKHELLRSLGASDIIDYRRDDFAAILRDIDVVLDTLGGADQARAFRILRPGGKLISIVGPPDPAFAAAHLHSAALRLGVRLISAGARRRARAAGATYHFLYMSPSGTQLGEIAALLEAGTLRPVLDKVFPFEQADQAMAYAETGRATGKVVIARIAS